ncbi:MAG: hypothetical protein ACJAR2_004189 [Ilumatobacter sp.]
MIGQLGIATTANAVVLNLALLRLLLPSGRVTLFTLGGSHLLADTYRYFLETSALAHDVDQRQSVEANSPQSSAGAKI